MGSAHAPSPQLGGVRRGVALVRRRSACHGGGALASLVGAGGWRPLAGGRAGAVRAPGAGACRGGGERSSARPSPAGPCAARRYR